MLKMISVELSEQCVMKPNCPFCYVKDIQKFKDKTDGYQNSWKWKLRGLIEKPGANPSDVTVCIEYNGYNIREIRDAFFIPKETHVTMTTMPMVVSDTFAGFIKAHRIESVGLSYDEFKSTPSEWVTKAGILRNHGLKVSCNYLLTKNGLHNLFSHFNNEEPSYIELILQTADQLNLLSIKPTGAYDTVTLEAIAIAIDKLKERIPVTLDNCLGVQLGYTDKCHAGDEFIHLLSDGTIVPCCFQDKCFLW